MAALLVGLVFVDSLDAQRADSPTHITIARTPLVPIRHPRGSSSGSCSRSVSMSALPPTFHRRHIPFLEAHPHHGANHP